MVWVGFCVCVWLGVDNEVMTLFLSNCSFWSTKAGSIMKWLYFCWVLFFMASVMVYIMMFSYAHTHTPAHARTHARAHTPTPLSILYTTFLLNLIIFDSSRNSTTDTMVSYQKLHCTQQSIFPETRQLQCQKIWAILSIWKPILVTAFSSLLSKASLGNSSCLHNKMILSNQDQIIAFNTRVWMVPLVSQNKNYWFYVNSFHM